MSDYKDSERVFSERAVRFYDWINSMVSLVYKSINRKKDRIPREVAVKNLETVIAWESTKRRDQALPLEKRLESFGKHYISDKELENAKVLDLWKSALKADRKGLIPKEGESVRDFVYRANAMLFFHRRIRKGEYGRDILNVNVDKKTLDVKLELERDYEGRRIKKKDLVEANKRIPYYMDLSWVSAFADQIPFGILGLCFTLPSYNGISFIRVKEKYRSREEFLKVLAHEMVHVGTVYLDSLHDFVETKAYSVGSGRLGEYVVALNKEPDILLKIIDWVSTYVVRIPVSDYFFKVIAKIRSGIKIAENTSTFKAVKRKLKSLYGEEGNYILGRLTADEMLEFRYTNNIPARIAGKKSLKWLIMKKNFRDL